MGIHIFLQKRFAIPVVPWYNNHMNTTHQKYPRTPHLPWSPGGTDDDVRGNLDLRGLEVVVTEKMDGENTTMYRDHIHARSLDSSYHPSRTWVTNLWGSIKHEIPEGWRICGENLQAVHSIAYDNLDSYFMVFGIYERGWCFSWDETADWAELFNLSVVPVLFRGVYENFEKWAADYILPDKSEGYVVRLADAFSTDDFHQKVAKYVRADHVQTDDHWSYGQIVENKLAIR
jgi:hypothetical protein